MHRRHVLSLIAASSALALPAWATTTESERFHQWLEAQWERTLERQPVLATSLGDPRYNEFLQNKDLKEKWKNSLGRHFPALGGLQKASFCN